jgi:hypothetical protein
MNGKQHKVSALSGAVILNNVINLCPNTPIKAVNIALHTAGPLHDPLHAKPGITSDVITNKVIFYAVAILAASIPDRIEIKRDYNHHRGFTHSLVFLATVTLSLFAIEWQCVANSHTGGVGQFGPICLGICSSILWHIIADMLTI